MIQNESIDNPLQGILNQLREAHNIDCTFVKDIEGGFINRKWQVHDSRTCYVVKELSDKRYSPKRMNHVMKSLEVQRRFSSEFGSAPKLYHFNDQVIHQCENIKYVLMDYVDGDHKDVHSITNHELYDIGIALANLHGMDVSDIYEPDYEDFYDTFLRHMEGVNHDSQNQSYLELVRKVEVVMDKVSPDFLNELSIGYTHSDFSKDNILFKNGKVQILDFDRGRIAYQLQDVGRAIISYAFDGESIDISKLDHLLRGYKSIKEITIEDAVNSLRLIWFIEVVWWVRESYFENTITNKLNEFRNEIIWLTDNIMNLDKIRRHYEHQY